jgi:hypothetical protein
MSILQKTLSQRNGTKPPTCPLNVPQILRLQSLEHNTMLSGLPVTKCVCGLYKSTELPAL